MSSSAVVILALSLGAEPPAYPRADLLLEATQFAKPAVAEHYRILDARDREDYDKGHVPAAVWVDEAAWSKAFAKGQDAEDWARRIGALGIDPDTPTVVYGKATTTQAARIWWILHYWGLKNVRLLNGGWHAWTDEHGRVVSDVPTVTPLAPHLMRHSDRLATRSDVEKGIKGSGFQLLDARSDAEYCGRTRMARRAGAIPRSVHLEWVNVIDPHTERFKSAEQLAELFRRAHVDLDTPLVTHCQSGGRAAVLAFALELMGAHQVRNYYRGWSEWGNTPNAPIVVPKSSKEPRTK